ncbi:hypothetical protein GF327_01245 [Candidatus Woesearchaeota archaeon]|nr:hypothetical protein [Candidatus Woesearchaeota archaeon]
MNKKEIIFFCGLFILSILLRVKGISDESLWLDESISIYHSQFSFSNIISPNEPHPPLYTLILKILFPIINHNIFRIRFISVVFGALSLPVFYFLVKKIFDKKIALISSVILCFSPYHIAYSQEARMYSLLFFLSAVSIFFFFDTIKNKKHIEYTVFSFLLLYSHFFSVFVIITQNIIFLIEHITVRKQDFKKWIVVQLILVISFIPHILRLSDYSKTTSSDIWRFSFFELRKLLPGISGSDSLFFLYTCLLIFFLFFLSSKSRKISSVKKEENVLIYVFLLFTIPILIPILFSLFFENIFMTRYVIYCLIPFTALLGYMIDRLPGLVKYCFLILILFLSLVSITRHNSEINNEDWNRIDSFIQDFRDENTIIILEPGYIIHSFVFYSETDCFSQEDIYRCAAEHNIFTLWNRFDQEKDYVNNALQIIYIRRKIFGSESSTQYYNYLSNNFTIINKAAYKTVYDVELQAFIFERT